MLEQLIRYLLGELDDDELVDLRARLKESPELQRELAHLRECFDANQTDDAEPLPSGSLAARTTQRIANSDEYELEQMCAGTKRLSSAADPPAGVLGWSLADLTVAVGVTLAVSMLVFPAIRDSRDGTRLNVCQNNQVQLWLAVSKYADNHGGRYPQVFPNETAGMFAARLVGEGYIEPEELAVLVICPSSQIANEIRAGRLVIRIPTREAIRSMTADQQQLAFAGVSPSYGYRLPYWNGSEYVDAFHSQGDRPTFDPVFGDFADSDSPTAGGARHRGSVIQLIGRNGAVTSFAAGNPPAYLSDSDLFKNKIGVVAAGIGADDIVLATSNAMPGRELGAHER
jgi:hypothetical protein